MGPSGGLMLDGDLLAYSSMAICPFTGLFLVAIHNYGALVREILTLAQQIRARMLLVRAASAIGLAETWVRPDRIWS